MIVVKLFRSPLLHFFAIGGLIFLAFAVVNDDPPPQPTDAIILTAEEAKRLAEQFAATWNRQPTQTELEGLMQSWALEEAFVREALALGLDRGDAIIRQRLNLKMGFLAESGVAALEADDENLQKYLDENPDRFVRPARMGFDQIFLEQQNPTEEISAIRAALQGGADPSSLGKASLLPSTIPTTSAPAIDRIFGNGFHAALSQLPTGSWQGPIESGYGLHLVRLDNRSDAVIPPLSEIRDRVESEWRAAKMKEMKDAFGRAMLDRYTVKLPPATEVLEN